MALTHLTDGKGAGGAGVDLRGAASGEIKQLHESRDHLIFLLCVSQPTVPTESPGEHAFLRVQHQLWAQTESTVTIRYRQNKPRSSDKLTKTFNTNLARKRIVDLRRRSLCASNCVRDKTSAAGLKPHRMVDAAGDVSHDHIGHRKNLSVLCLFNKDADPAGY